MKILSGNYYILLIRPLKHLWFTVLKVHLGKEGLRPLAWCYCKDQT